MPSLNLQVTLTIDDAAAQRLAGGLSAAFKQALHSVLNVPTLSSPLPYGAYSKPTNDQQLLISSREAAKLLKVSDRMLFGMQKSGAIPGAVKLGRLVRWNLQTLKSWLEAGCPPVVKKTNE